MDFMATDNFVLLILVLTFGIPSMLGILLLLYVGCHKPNRYSTKTKYPQRYINHTPSKKLGGDKTNIRRPH